MKLPVAIPALLVLTAHLLLAIPAHACTQPPPPPPLHKVAAEEMGKAATYIEIAEVVGFGDNFDFALRPNKDWPDFPPFNTASGRAEARKEWKDEGAVTIRYRVLETIKGPKQAGFTFSGLRDSPRTAQPKPDPRLPQLRAYLDQVDLADVSDYNMCTRAISGGIGRTYLIFRDKHGNALRPIVSPVRNGAPTNPYPSIVEVRTGDDAWVRLVRSVLR